MINDDFDGDIDISVEDVYHGFDDGVDDENIKIHGWELRRGQWWRWMLTMMSVDEHNLTMMSGALKKSQ